jgi:hypothetical protein
VPFVAIVCGLLLVGLGADGYFDAFGLIRPSELYAKTSLIPAYFGAALVVCGVVALKANLLKHAMHLAALVGLMGFLAGAGMGLPKLPRLMDGAAEHPAAVRSQLWLGAVCFVFVLLCVISFVQARRRRRAAAV